MPMGSKRFSVIGCIFIENILKISTTLSLIKLKYLKKNRTPKHAIKVPIKIYFLITAACVFSNNNAAIYDTIVVNKISTTYLGFQLI